MGLFGNREAKKRMSMFRTLARDMLMSMEKQRWPSCEAIIMRELDTIVKSSEKDFAEFPAGYNYEKMALDVIGYIAFQEVSSGQYHFYHGYLKPVGMQLKEVCVQSAFRAKVKGYLDDDDYHDFLDRLSDGIKSMG